MLCAQPHTGECLRPAVFVVAIVVLAFAIYQVPKGNQALIIAGAGSKGDNRPTSNDEHAPVVENTMNFKGRHLRRLDRAAGPSARAAPVAGVAHRRSRQGGRGAHRRLRRRPHTEGQARRAAPPETGGQPRTAAHAARPWCAGAALSVSDAGGSDTVRDTARTRRAASGSWWFVRRSGTAGRRAGLGWTGSWSRTRDLRTPMDTTDPPLTQEDGAGQGVLSAISNEMVRIYKDQFGRGPKTARQQGFVAHAQALRQDPGEAAREPKPRIAGRLSRQPPVPARLARRTHLSLASFLGRGGMRRDPVGPRRHSTTAIRGIRAAPVGTIQRRRLATRADTREVLHIRRGQLGWPLQQQVGIARRVNRRERRIWGGRGPYLECSIMVLM